MTDSAEIKRILEMVESGRISPAEGARLMDSLKSAAPTGTSSCPYCAESIPDHSRHCPECGSSLDIPVPRRTGEGGAFSVLTGLGKFLVIYTLAMSAIKLLSLLAVFSLPGFVGCLIAAIGLTGGILILRSHPAGWNLGILWAALQIITVIIRGEIINVQVLHLGINYNVNGQGFGINLIGIILLILFIKAKPAGY